MYLIKENTNNIKSKKRFYEDKHLKQLTKLTLKYSNNIHLLNYIKNMLYYNNSDKYDESFSKITKALPNNYKEVMQINDLFKTWQPTNKYNMGELRGNFLEILYSKVLERKYSTNKIHKESNIIIEDYHSHTWDFIVELEKILKCYECKFSPSALQRKHINQMIGLYNKLDTSRPILVSFTNKTKIIDCIKLLRENTNPDKYHQNITHIQIISIENITLT